MANDITILSCPQCGFPLIRDCGNGLYQCDDCGTHFDKNENIVLTNEDLLRSGTTEELAGKIYAWHTKGYARGNNGLPLNSITEIVEWLKQPHNSPK